MRKLNAGYLNYTLQDGYSETVNIKLDSETPKFLCRANANVRSSPVFLVDVCAAAAAHGALLHGLLNLVHACLQKAGY